MPTNGDRTDESQTDVRPVGMDLSVLPFHGSTTDWDDQLGNFDGATFCHFGGWRKIMSEVLGHEPLYRVAVDGDGRTRGLMPMVRVKSRFFGDYLVSMPFLSYGGPIGSGLAREALVRDAEKTARGLGVDLLELRSRNPVPGGLSRSDRKVTVLLDLPDDPHELWTKGLRAKVRSQVRRPQKEGMKVHFGPECAPWFYRVFSRTMRDLGTPVLPRQFFESLAAEFPAECVFCTVEFEGEAVAAGCGFFWAGEFEITWAGSLRKHSSRAPNMLLYWSLMEHTISRGGRVFNFGRCSPGSGSHRFKKQWGGKDYPLPWAQWAKKGVASTPTPDQQKFQMAISAWQRMPLSVANWLGPKLSRYIP